MDTLNLPTNNPANNSNEIPPVSLPPQTFKNFLKGSFLIILSPFIFRIIISLIFLIRFLIDSQRISLPSFLYDFVGAIITCAIIYLLAKLIKIGKPKIFSLIIFVILIILLALQNFFYKEPLDLSNNESPKNFYFLGGKLLDQIKKGITLYRLDTKNQSITQIDNKVYWLASNLITDVSYYIKAEGLYKISNNESKSEKVNVDVQFNPGDKLDVSPDGNYILLEKNAFVKFIKNEIVDYYLIDVKNYQTFIIQNALTKDMVGANGSHYYAGEPMWVGNTLLFGKANGSDECGYLQYNFSKMALEEYNDPKIIMKDGGTSCFPFLNASNDGKWILTSQYLIDNQTGVKTDFPYDFARSYFTQDDRYIVLEAGAGSKLSTISYFKVFDLGLNKIIQKEEIRNFPYLKFLTFTGNSLFLLDNSRFIKLKNGRQKIVDTGLLNDKLNYIGESNQKLFFNSETAVFSFDTLTGKISKIGKLDNLPSENPSKNENSSIPTVSKETPTLYFAGGTKGNYTLTDLTNGATKSFLPVNYEIIDQHSYEPLTDFLIVKNIYDSNPSLSIYDLKENKINDIKLSGDKLSLKVSERVILYPSISEKGKFYIEINEVYEDKEGPPNPVPTETRSYFFDALTNNLIAANNFSFNKTVGQVAIENFSIHKEYDSLNQRFFVWYSREPLPSSLPVFITDLEGKNIKEIISPEEFGLQKDHLGSAVVQYNQGWIMAWFQDKLIAFKTKDPENKKIVISFSQKVKPEETHLYSALINEVNQTIVFGREKSIQLIKYDSNNTIIDSKSFPEKDFFYSNFIFENNGFLYYQTKDSLKIINLSSWEIEKVFRLPKNEEVTLLQLPLGYDSESSLQKPDVFSGEWVYLEKNNEGQENSFLLTLSQRGTNLTGSHCFILYNAKYTDCELVNTITGKVIDNKANITLKSVNSEKPINVILELTIDGLVLKTSSPNQGVPEQITLRRKK